MWDQHNTVLDRSMCKQCFIGVGITLHYASFMFYRLAVRASACFMTMKMIIIIMIIVKILTTITCPRNGIMSTRNLVIVSNPEISNLYHIPTTCFHKIRFNVHCFPPTWSSSVKIYTSFIPLACWSVLFYVSKFYVEKHFLRTILSSLGPLPLSSMSSRFGNQKGRFEVSCNWIRCCFCSSINITDCDVQKMTVF
jgi:hypothetical protein